MSQTMAAMAKMLSRDFPRYRSHKEVQASKIGEGIEFREDGSVVLPISDLPGGLHFVIVDKQVVARYMPMPGDYLVVYADGYHAISPAKAFEEGYTRIEDQDVPG